VQRPDIEKSQQEEDGHEELNPDDLASLDSTEDRMGSDVVGCDGVVKLGKREDDLREPLELNQGQHGEQVNAVSVNFISCLGDNHHDD